MFSPMQTSFTTLALCISIAKSVWILAGKRTIGSVIAVALKLGVVPVTLKALPLVEIVAVSYTHLTLPTNREV